MRSSISLGAQSLSAVQCPEAVLQMLPVQPLALEGPQVPAAVTGSEAVGIMGHFQLEVGFTDHGKRWVPSITSRSPSRMGVLGSLQAPAQGTAPAPTLCAI